MNLLKKCLIEFNNQWTNKITEKEVDDDEQLRFTLLDMQNFAKKYVEAINYTHCCEELKELDSDNFEDWLIVNGYAVFDNYYLKGDIAFSESELIDIYNKEVMNL